MNMIGDHYFFSLRIRLLGIIFLALASGCASVPSVNDSSLSTVPDADAAAAVVLPIMRAAYPPLINNAAVSAAIVSTLQRYGFAVASVSPETGLVETDWRMATEADEKFSNTVIPGVPRDKNQAYKERIKLIFSVDGESSSITVQPYKQQQSEDGNWNDVEHGDMLLVHNVVTVAIFAMGGSVESPRWIYSLDDEPKRKPQEKQDRFGDNAGKIALFSFVAIIVAVVLISG